MGTPAAVLGDRAVSTCAVHVVPSPNPSGMAPQPAMPFSAPLTTGLAATVLVGGKPAVVVGSSGLNAPPHLPPLHPSDPAMVPTQQQAVVTVGSPTVLAEGRPMARTGSTALCCLPPLPGTVTGTAATVLVA